MSTEWTMEELAREVNEKLHDRTGEYKIKGDSHVRALLASLNKTLFEMLKTIVANTKSEQLGASMLKLLKTYEAQSHKDKISAVKHIQSVRVSWYHYNSFSFFRFLIESCFEELAGHSPYTRRECAKFLAPFSVAIQHNTTRGVLPEWMVESTEDSEAALVLADQMSKEPEREEEVQRPKRKTPDGKQGAVPPPAKRPDLKEKYLSHDFEMLIRRYIQFDQIEALNHFKTMMEDAYEDLSSRFPIDRVSFCVDTASPPRWASLDHALFKVEPLVRVAMIEAAIRRGASFSSIFVDTATEEGVCKLVMPSSTAEDDDAESDFEYNPATKTVIVSVEKIPVY